jgi:predicted RND superfamily exporter protein
VFKTTDVIFDSVIRFSSRGFWEEIKGYQYLNDELKSQRMKLGKTVFKASEDFESDGMEVIAFTWRFRNNETKKLINEDFMFVGLVFIACLAYMTFHTGSLYISTLSLLNIFLSIPITLVIYTYVIGVTYFSSLHMSIFIIIIGIGSDDIFVFHEFYKNTQQIKALADKPILRLSHAFRHASQSMFVTSVTSAVAFFSCTLSPIMPIASFGWFATIIVPLVYI